MDLNKVDLNHKSFEPSDIEAVGEMSAPVRLDKDGTHLLIPMFLILPLSTSSSSFCQVGYGSAVRSSSKVVVPSLNATGLVGISKMLKLVSNRLTSESSTSQDNRYQAW